MNYKQKYEEALERAKYYVNAYENQKNTLTESVMEAVKDVFPELKESADEDVRMRKWIYGVIANLYFPADEDADKELKEMQPLALAWLEKQEENPKSACTSDAKYENVWHRVVDSLPEDTREVLCKDAIGNYFIGRYYKISKSWRVMVYDGPDESNEDNPPVIMWVDIPSEKQKERKPGQEVDWTKLTWEDINELEDLMAKVHYEFRNGISAEGFGKEVLERFREIKGDEYLDDEE